MSVDGADTLRAYDEARYLLGWCDPLFDGASGEVKPYRGSLFLHQAQVDLGGCKETVLLSMAAAYIYAQLCESSSALLKKYIPYRYVPGRHHGKIEGKFRRWDMRVDAHGWEAVVEELQRRIWAYEDQRFDRHLTWWDTERRSCAWFVHDTHSSEPTMQIILSDKVALNQIHLHSLLVDCHRIEAPIRVLERQVAQEKRLLEQFLKEQYAEVVQTHASNVTHLRQRYRISSRAGWPPHRVNSPKVR